MTRDLKPLEAKLGVEFKDPDRLRQALVHRSYINEHPKFALSHNERLEYLGDAVLELAVTEFLYQHYPNPEGDLTNWRASVVNSKILADIAREVGIDEFIYLSRGEAKDQNGKARQSILANAFEAVIGALYLDQGFKACQQVVEQHVLDKLPDIIANRLYLDPKSRLQEASQDRLGLTPLYRVLAEWGPDHDKHFRVAVYFGDEEAAVGEGASKQEAQVQAAEAALRTKGW